MKDGILTWYKALNHGAVLQAYATQNYLKEHGFETMLLDYDRTLKNTNSLCSCVKTKVRKLLNGYARNRKAILRMNQEKRILFQNFIDKYLQTGDNCYKEDVNHLIIGSDMVFNLKQGFSPYMFGIGMNAKHIMAYAACAGGTDMKLVKKMHLVDELRTGLSKFEALGLRDQESKELVHALLPDRKLVENIDPVLLYGFDKEMQNWDTGKWGAHDDYILVYAYHGCMDSKSEIMNIKKFAQQEKLNIISAGYYHSWCDEIINPDPREFLEMFKYASYIVTDTFHGTVFSIVNQKPFVSIIRGNGYKLRYLLECCFLKDRIASDSRNIGDILYKTINYEKCNAWLEIQRKQSGDFLLSGINN